MGDLEAFIHDQENGIVHSQPNKLPPLVVIALVHAQFETIHPFLDGNGRIGRLLISALLEDFGLMKQPLLYLSAYLKKHQFEYYRLLSGIRGEGDWEAWIRFFLEGIQVAANESRENIIQLSTVVNEDRRRVLEAQMTGTVAYRLFELLLMMPRFTVEGAREALGTTFPTANAAVKSLEELGLISEKTGNKKNRTYSYDRYIQILST
jgi:Fic family protein